MFKFKKIEVSVIPVVRTTLEIIARKYMISDYKVFILFVSTELRRAVAAEVTLIGAPHI